MYVPRLRTSCTASANFSAPAATSAEYSPRLCPATKSGVSPFSASTRYTATEHVKIAGWVLAVSLSSSSVPSKQILEIDSPRASSASSKTARAAGYFSASSLPIPGYCEACPGNTNATLPIVNPFLALSRNNGGGRQLLFDFLVHARAGESRRHTDGVLHGVGVRTPVRDHANAAHAQQRGAAVLRVINRLSQRLEGAFRKHPAHLRNQRTVHGLPQQAENLKRQAFANLQRDVAHEAITHDDIHVAGKQIPAFDIADKMHRTLLQSGVNLARQLVALDLFFADREQSDARALAAKGRAVVDLSHHRELDQVLGFRIHVRTYIEQHGNAALGVRKRRGQGHAIHRLQRSEQKFRHSHDRAGVSRAHHSVGLRFAHQTRRHVHRTVPLPPECLRGMIIHSDHFACRHDLDRQVRGSESRQLRAHHLRLAHEQNANAKLPYGQHTAFDLGAGRVVSAHGVNGDGDHGIFVRRLSERNSNPYDAGSCAALPL